MGELLRYVANEFSLSHTELDLLTKIFEVKIDSRNIIEQIFIKRSPENSEEETKIIIILKKVLINKKVEVILDKNLDIANKKRKIALSLIEGTFADLYPNLVECFYPPYAKEQVLKTFNEDGRISKDIIKYFSDGKTSFLPPPNDLHGIIELLNLIYDFFKKLAPQEEKQPSVMSETPSAKIIRIINCPLLNRRPDWCLENAKLNLVKGLYYGNTLKQYPIWLIDEVINALSEEEKNIIAKAYGPNMRFPMRTNSPGSNLTSSESKKLKLIKYKLLSMLKKKSLENLEKNICTLKINTSDYRELTRVLMENYTGCNKDADSQETKNTIIVFLYLGLGEVQPLSIELIASIYGLTICKTKDIIINTLIKFRGNLQIQWLIDYIIRLLQSGAIALDKPIEINPCFKNKNR